MGPCGLRFELIYLVGTDYEGQISFKFTFVHKSILVVTQDCTWVSERGLQIGLIDLLVGLIELVNQLGPILG